MPPYSATAGVAVLAAKPMPSPTPSCELVLYQTGEISVEIDDASLRGQHCQRRSISIISPYSSSSVSGPSDDSDWLTSRASSMSQDECNDNDNDNDNDDYYYDDYDDDDEASRVVDRIRTMLLQETDAAYVASDYLSRFCRRETRGCRCHGCDDNNNSHSNKSSSSSSSSSNSGDMIDDECRTKMVRWMYDVTNYCDISRECVAVAASYLDRFLSSATANANTNAADECRRVAFEALSDRRTYQLAAMTSLYLSIKLTEPVVVSPELLSRISRGEYSASDFVAMEQHMLNALEWRVTCPTSMDFARHFLELLLLHRRRQTSQSRSCCRFPSVRRQGGWDDDDDYDNDDVDDDDHEDNSDEDSDSDYYEDIIMYGDDCNSNKDSDNSMREEFERFIKKQIEQVVESYDLSVRYPPSVIAEAAISNCLLGSSMTSSSARWAKKESKRMCRLLDRVLWSAAGMEKDDATTFRRAQVEDAARCLAQLTAAAAARTTTTRTTMWMRKKMISSSVRRKIQTTISAAGGAVAKTTAKGSWAESIVSPVCVSNR